MKGKATIGEVAVVRNSEKPVPPVIPEPLEKAGKKVVIAECRTYGSTIRVLVGKAVNGNPYEQIQKIVHNHKTKKDEYSSMTIFENETENMDYIARLRYHKKMANYCQKKHNEQEDVLKQLDIEWEDDSE